MDGACLVPEINHRQRWIRYLIFSVFGYLSIFLIASSYSLVLDKATFVYVATYLSFYILDFLGTSKFVFGTKTCKKKFVKYLVSVAVLLYIGSIIFDLIFSAVKSVGVATVLAGITLAPVRYLISTYWIYAESPAIASVIANLLGSIVRVADVFLRKVLKLNFSRSPGESLFKIWVKSLFGFQNIDVLIDLDLPGWPFKVESKVDNFLKETENSRVFEWGSGASSVWLAKRSGSVISIEHDTSWTIKMLGIVNQLGMKNLEIRYVGARSTMTPVVPSNKSGFRNLDFEEYVNTLEVLGKFDLIIIDGRARVDCWNRAVNHLNPNGMILFGNSNRKRYILRFAELSLLNISGLTPASPWPTESMIAQLKS